MKKLLIILLTLCIFCFSGCGLNMNNVDKKPSFSGKVLEVHSGYILVDGENIGGVNVTRQTVLPEGSPDLSAGDTVTVYYDGNIMESYPAQLGEVYAIVVTEKASDNAMYNTVEGLHMEPKATAKGRLTVDVINGTDTEIYSGNRHDFSLQVCTEDGEWLDVPMLEGEFANTSEALIFPAGESTELVFEWEWRYGELESGHYRAVKTFFGDDYFTSQVQVTAEFDVE